MIYEVINPSDPVTLEAQDIEAAQAACLLLGEGAYALHDADGKEVMPLFLLGGLNEWAEQHKFDLGRIRRDKLPAVIECLESAACCEIRDRQAILAAVGDDPEALARYNDTKRSSLNDICGRAFKLAAGLKDCIPDKEIQQEIKEGVAEAKAWVHGDVGEGT